MPPWQRPAPPGERPSLLKDPCGDRPCKELPLPPAQLLTSDVYYNEKQKPDLNLLMEHLNLEGYLTQELLLGIIKRASELFEGEPNLLKLNDPITVVGDIHGQYYDLIKLLEVGGLPGDTQYLFLGDYVDRGSFSVEVVALLYSIKIRHPKRIRMLRGNHECRQMTTFFNFREECEYKYDISVYNAFMESFDTLPLAATINGKFLALHGGLSPELPKMKAVNGINRFQEPPREGLFCDLLWSDPLEKEEDKKPRGKVQPPFIHNEVRGCSYYFSFDGVAKFLSKNSLLSIIRAHEVQLEGYKMHRTNPATGFPSVITIFSAPNYCDVYNNKGAILKFDNSTLNILQFNCSPHPYHLPNFMDVFAWSIPFVVEKVTEMLYAILQPSASDPVVPSIEGGTPQMDFRVSLSPEQNKVVELATRLATELESEACTGDAAPTQDGDQRDRMRKKVRSVARMAKMFKTLRQENETVVRLKGACPGHRLRPGLLLAGRERLENELELFEYANRIDEENERMPQVDGSEGPAGAPGIPAQATEADFVSDVDDQEGDADDAESAGGRTEASSAPAAPPARTMT